jgi:hypothetical protein
VALHISGDDRPGFAILDFKRDIGSEDLTITLQSKLLHFGEYLSNEGTWTATPCFFKATRLPGKGHGVYQIGPEIVNRGGLALDFIEVCVSGTEIVEDVTWPVLAADPNAVPVHAAAAAPSEPTPASAEEPVPDGDLKPAGAWDEAQDAEAEEAKPAPEAAAIEPEPAQSLELAEAREEAPQEHEAGDAGPSPEAAVIEPEPAKAPEPLESLPEAPVQDAQAPEPEKAGPSPEAQAVKPQFTKGSEPMQKPERARTNDIEPEDDQAAKARTKEELMRWLEALPRGSASSPHAAMPSSEKLEMELGARPRAHTPSNGPRPSEPQGGPAGRQMSGSASVLELLPNQHQNRQPWALYGLSAAAALGSLLIFSVWLFCIPFLGVKCKSGGGFEAAVSCARGGSLDACGIALTRKSEEESARSREAASRERAKAEAAMRELLRREAEERQAAEAAAQEETRTEAAERQAAEAAALEQAKTEAAARERARREAGERQAAEAAAQEQAKTEAAAREKAKREAGERQAAEAAAQEQAKTEAAAREKVKREAGERQAAEAAAQERAKTEAMEREKARLDSEERDRAERETREKTAQAIQATASASLYLQPASTLAVPEGNYSGRTVREESCSPTAESIIVTVKSGKICWEHDLSAANQWAGTIDPAGAVAARVRDRPGTSAAGQVVNGGAMSIEMTYPGCANPIRIKLLGMIGAASACP